MPKRISKGKNQPQDINQAAFLMVEKTTSSKSEISRVMSAMGRKGGRIGGKKRLKSMTAEERSQVALKAAKARWGKAKAAAIEQPPPDE